MDFRCGAIVFPGAHQVLRIFTPRQIPVGSKPFAQHHIEIDGKVRLGKDSEIGVTEFDGPLILTVRHQNRRIFRGGGRTQASLAMK